jgi:hypothetical protein
MGVRLIFAPSLRHNIRVARVHNVVQRVCAPPSCSFAAFW